MSSIPNEKTLTWFTVRILHRSAEYFEREKYVWQDSSIIRMITELWCSILMEEREKGSWGRPADCKTRSGLRNHVIRGAISRSQDLRTGAAQEIPPCRVSIIGARTRIQVPAAWLVFFPLFWVPSSWACHKFGKTCWNSLRRSLKNGLGLEQWKPATCHWISASEIFET